MDEIEGRSVQLELPPQCSASTDTILTIFSLSLFFHFLPSIISNIENPPHTRTEESLLIKVWRFKDGRKFYDTMPFSLRYKHSILHELTRYRRWQIFYLLLEINFIRFAARLMCQSGFLGTHTSQWGNA